MLWLRQGRLEVTAAFLHRTAVVRARCLPAEQLKLELGSGWQRKPGWVHIDLMNRQADLRLDLRRPLPFQTGAAQEIHSEHFLEHLQYLEGLALLRECFRVLANDGRLDIGVPNLLPSLKAYVAEDRSHFARSVAWETENGCWHEPAWSATPMQRLNYMFRQNGEHRFIYDFETLRLALGEVGFGSVERRKFDPNRDSETRRGRTMWVEARK
jgi:predicted SAM-dependent methyltransferase